MNTMSSLSLFESLPEHCLELILDYLDCEDFNSMLKSSRRLADVGREVRRMREMRLHQVLRQNGIANWRLLHSRNIRKKEISPGDRFGSTLVYYDRSIYLFGGATINWTSFNDLWRFDLREKSWSRRLPRGTCPPPRASATAILHGDKLIIIGGFELTYSFHAKGMSNWDNLPWIYDFTRNEWKMMMVDTSMLPLIESDSSHGKFTVSPTPVGQSSCLMMDDKIILFGGAKALLNQSQGYHRHTPIHPIGLSNNTLSLSVYDSTINSVNVFGEIRPLKRCGHSAMSIDRSKMLILGGNLGPNTKGTEDMWMLSCVEPSVDSCTCEYNNNSNVDRIWYWTKIHIDTKFQPVLSFLNNAIIFSGENKVTSTLIVLGGSVDEVEQSMMVNNSNIITPTLMQRKTEFHNKSSRLIVHSVDLASIMDHKLCNDCGRTILLNETNMICEDVSTSTISWIMPRLVCQDFDHAPFIKQGFGMVTSDDSLFLYGGLCYKSVYTRPVCLLNDLMTRDSDSQEENVFANSDLHQLTFAKRAITL